LPVIVRFNVLHTNQNYLFNTKINVKKSAKNNRKVSCQKLIFRRRISVIWWFTKNFFL
jgi:hypothetical protein